MVRKNQQLTEGKKEKTTRKSDVIVDFIFKKGLFFISIKNISSQPAFKVSVKFNKRILGVDGTREVSALALFKNIEFLPPQKEIVTFLDSSASYFRRGEPTKISATISYEDSSGKKKTSTIKHDIGIYKDIGYISEHSDMIDLRE